MDTRLFNRIQQKKAQLDKLRPLPQQALLKLQEQLAIEWTYNSNAIEGSTLTLRETQLIIEQGITIGGKSLQEHFEVINHQEAINFVENLVEQHAVITPYLVRQIHALVLAKIDEENAGKFRTVPVRIVGSAHRPTEPWDIQEQMNKWGEGLKNLELSLDPIMVSTVAHHELVSIHPFIDGNGRTARLVMNLILMKAGYPPAIIAKENRQQYYSVLSQADRGNITPFINLVGRAVERNLTLYIESSTPQIEPPLNEERWIPLSEAALHTKYSQEYLSLLARTGKLEAKKIGRIWHTTQKALRAYSSSLGNLS